MKSTKNILSYFRNSLVGTTVRMADKLPEDLVADEKHTSINGEKTYIVTTVGDECILGAAMSPRTGEKDLTKAYGQFKGEALNLDPDYQPTSVNTDIWDSWTAISLPETFSMDTLITAEYRIRAWPSSIISTPFVLDHNPIKTAFNLVLIDLTALTITTIGYITFSFLAFWLAFAPNHRFR